ncbi:MAG: hypothetical protein HY075_03220 [Deltaproteobacteria bacterium]|nr:hypothetical protein [Deltaproteobacteria bacterium]
MSFKSIFSSLLLVTAVAAPAFAQDLFTADDLSASLEQQGVELNQGAIVSQQEFSMDGYERVACFARNRRGQQFEAIGRNPRFVQEEAIRQCYRFSRVCRAEGCRRTYVRRAD